MTSTATRRAVLVAAGLLAVVPARPSRGQDATTPGNVYPLALPGRAPGDGFLVRHGYVCENTWYNPGDWHTGEDWYRLDGAETGGVDVIAVGAGEVVFVGSDYPGRVVIVRHEEALYSMYGHLAYEPSVAEGETVATGQVLGTVLTQVDAPAPSHLHFEVRTFLTTPEVNGDAPRYGYACGPNCLPGPGYWPIDAPDHPSDQGWRTPMHALAARMFADDLPPVGSAVVVAEGAPGGATLWSAPSDEDGAEQLGEVTLTSGDRYPWLGIATGRAASTGSSAEAYRLWYQVETPEAGPGWLQAALPDAGDTGSDGRPSSIRLVLVPGALIEDG